MKEFLLWWVGIEAVGLAAFPLSYAFFRRLPDRGFAFSKVIGLLLLGYGLWAGAVVGAFPNSRGSVILLLLIIAGLSAVAAGRYREEMTGYLRSGWRYIAFVEGLFFVVLVGGVFIRSFAPEIIWGEKPFELAFLNSVSRSEFFPPQDPWLADHSISYYYFGYVMVSALSKLVALGANVTFYLALSLMAALVAVTVFGLVYNLIAAGRDRAAARAAEGPSLVPRAVVFGLAGAAFVLVVSNLAGVFELMARHGIGSRGFYGQVGIFGLDGPYDCTAAPGDCADWYPTRFWWWWKATRMGSPFDIQEFPFFSFQFGDLHAHVLAMPFLVTLLAVAFQMFLGGRVEARAVEGEETAERLDGLWALRHPGRFLLLALLMGGLVFIDAWALPLAVLMLLGATLVANWLRTGGRPLQTLADSAGFALPLIAAMFLFYTPFYWHLEADAEGLSITQTALTASPPPASEATRPLHFALFWGPLLWVVLSFIAVYLYRRWREATEPPLPALATAFWALPVGLWTLLVIMQTKAGLGWNPLDWSIDAQPSLNALADELRERGASLLTALMLAVCVTAAALAFLHRLRRADGEEDRSQLFVFCLAGFAFLMLLGAEFYFIKDILGWRANTVFRFWHQSWTLLSIVAAFGLYRLTLGWRLPVVRPGEVPWPSLAAAGVAFGAGYTVLVAVDPRDVLAPTWWTAILGLFVGGASVLAYAVAAALREASGPRAWGRLAWLGATAVLLAAALVYPVTVTLERTDGFRNSEANVRSLNGLVHVQRGDPLEYEAIEWLNRNVTGTPVVLEAVGDDYSDYGRVSARTGLPTVIGWVGHEITWRGQPDAAAAGPGAELPFTVLPSEVTTIYTTTDAAQAESLLERYQVEYVYVGRLEREKYGEGGLAKFRQFMTPVFENGEVTIYQMPPAPGAVRASR